MIGAKVVDLSTVDMDEEFFADKFHGLEVVGKGLTTDRESAQVAVAGGFQDISLTSQPPQAPGSVTHRSATLAPARIPILRNRLLTPS